MAKIRKSELKKHLQQMTKEELENELLILFDKHSQVQEHYTQDLGSDQDRTRLLNSYKERIRKLFGSFRRLPLVSGIRKIINEYKKVSIFPYELAQLLIYRIELTLEVYEEQGFLPTAFHNSTVNAFEELCEIIKGAVLFEQFEKDMILIICNKNRKTNYLGPSLVEIYNRNWNKPFPVQVKYHISYFNTHFQ